jgi:uncharacterized protein YebE (UPF0316 family)
MVRKCLVKEYVYVIKVSVRMLMVINVVRNVACLSNEMDYIVHVVGIIQEADQGNLVTQS